MDAKNGAIDLDASQSRETVSFKWIASPGFWAIINDKHLSIIGSPKIKRRFFEAFHQVRTDSLQFHESHSVSVLWLSERDDGEESEAGTS